MARGKAGGAVGGADAVDLVTAGEDGVEGRVLEVPHEGSGIEEVYGGDAETRWRGRAHSGSG